MKRAGFVVDYQNMHLVGNTLFAKEISSNKTFISPIKLAQAVLRSESIQISDVRVFRGLPSNRRESAKYALNMKQKSLWEKDKNVTVHHVPLKYRKNGLPPQEKGIDVLAAVNLFEMSESKIFDFLYLFSHDSDFIPVLKLIHKLGRTQIISVGWQGRQPLHVKHEQIRYLQLTQADYWKSVF
jgi:uncharacterized LabA/DUF88 family protein